METTCQICGSETTTQTNGFSVCIKCADRYGIVKTSKFNVSFPNARKVHRITAEQLMIRYTSLKGFRPAKNISEAVRNLNAIGFIVEEI